jgi:hypothetical protein
VQTTAKRKYLALGISNLQGQLSISTKAPDRIATGAVFILTGKQIVLK